MSHTDAAIEVKDFTAEDIQREVSRPDHERIDGFEIGFIEELEAENSAERGDFMVAGAIRKAAAVGRPMGLFEPDGTFVAVIVSPEEWKILFELKQKSMI